MRPWPLLACLALLVLGAAPSTAHANPESEARARFLLGRRLFAHGKHTEAREAFEEAHRILPNPRVLANIAACLAAEERPVDAIRTYRRFLLEAGEEVPDSARQTALREIERLREHSGDLLLAVEPDGAEVILDGEPVGTSPLPYPIAVTPGEHLLEVRSEGLAPYSRTLEAEAGGETNLSVVLRAPSLPEPPSEEAGPRAVPTDSGQASVGRGPLLWVGIVVTSALAIGAGTTGVLALNGKSEYEDPETSIPRRRELLDSTRTLATVTDVLVWSAVGVGIATLALYVFGGPGDEPPAEQPAPQATLRISEGGLALGIGTAF